MEALLLVDGLLGFVEFMARRHGLFVAQILGAMVHEDKITH